MPRGGLFEYVPPEERSGCVRAAGFATAAVLIVSAVAAAGITLVTPWGYFTGAVLFRFVPLAMFGGIVLWRWLREDPQRR